MKVFEEVLMEKGIENFPRTKLGRLFFKMKWRKARKVFEEFVTLQTRKIYLLKYLSRILQVIWNLEEALQIPYEMPKVCFSTPEEAMRKYAERICELRALDVWKWYKQTNSSLRRKWVNDIVLKAKEKGASLVVIKNSYIPYEEKAEIFDEDVKNGIEVKIYSVTDKTETLEWVAFNPMKPVDTDKWGMIANTSKVTFIL